jgi:predicted aminopeptidase
MKIVMLLLMSTSLSACYYMQAATGQWEVLRKRQSVDEVIADAATSPELAQQLRLLREARDFSIEVLHLPDNNSYRTYTQLQRDYVVWNVFAAPEFSLQPKRWCFPVVGCVSYRGYFSKDSAIRKSEQLTRQGYDVAVGGVAAYSTLGRFSDPLLSTMMRWDDVRLVAVLFHELAHQLVYVKGDTAFNESFATAVEEYGVGRWLKSRGQGALLDAYQQRRALQQRTLRLVQSARQDLAEIFTANDDAQKRIGKQQRLTQLSEEVVAELRASGRDVTEWYGGKLNNAHLISLVLYEGHLPVFRAIFRDCVDDVRCFYAAVEELAALDFYSRGARLDQLNTGVLMQE